MYLGSIPSLAADFLLFASEAILFKKAKNRFADVSLETQEESAVIVMKSNRPVVTGDGSLAAKSHEIITHETHCLAKSLEKYYDYLMDFPTIKETYSSVVVVINLVFFSVGIILILIFVIRKSTIYNEARWIRAGVLLIPWLGRSIDSLLYKKGNDTDWFIAGEELESGDNCFLNVSDGKFYKASARSQETGSTLIIKALQRIKKDKRGIFLVKGKYYSKDIKRGILFLSLESGKLTDVMPTGTDNVIRIISSGLNEKEEYFNPENDWITHV